MVTEIAEKKWASPANRLIRVSSAELPVPIPGKGWLLKDMDDTIDLRELILTVIRGRWLIAAIISVFVVASGVLSFFVLPPKYEATASLLVNTPTDLPEAPERGGIDAILQQVAPYPRMTLETFRHQVTDRIVLVPVIEELGLRMTPRELSKKINARIPRDTNLLEIVVQDSDPNLVARIANTMVKHYMAQMDRVNQGSFQRSAAFVQGQIEVEQENLWKALADLKAFLEQSPGVDALQSEVDAKVGLVARYKAQEIELQVAIQKTEEKARAARRQVSAVPQRLTTSRGIHDDPYLQELAAELGRTDITRLSGLKIESEETNPVWLSAASQASQQEIDLAALRAEQQALLEAVTATERELDTLRTKLAERSIMQEQLQLAVNVSREAVRALSEKHQEARMSEAARITQTTLVLASEALPPIKPVGPRKLFNVALAGVLGGILSVFTVLFLQFWRSAPRGTDQLTGTVNHSGSTPL